MSIGDKLMNISNDDTQNCVCCRLQLLVKSSDTQLNKPTNKNPIKLFKVVNSPMSPLSMEVTHTKTYTYQHIYTHTQIYICTHTKLSIENLNDGEIGWELWISGLLPRKGGRRPWTVNYAGNQGQSLKLWVLSLNSDWLFLDQ